MDKLEQQIRRFREAARRRRQALSMRRKNKTLQEIGDALGVSRQRADQMVKEALRDEQSP